MLATWECECYVNRKQTDTRSDSMRVTAYQLKEAVRTTVRRGMMAVLSRLVIREYRLL